MHRRTGKRVLVHGLSVDSTADSARAVNLRTGKEYWRYERQDEGSVVMSFDVSGRTVMIAYDTEDGRLAWRLKAPAGQEYGSGVIADGRVYLVRQPLLTEADATRRVRDSEMLVLDADTGHALHTLRLPAMTAPDDDVYFMKLDVHQVTDRALSLSWRELSTDEQLIITD
ncbi:PQQ-binding-like beta-propeller repeat protein [Streptomyces phaeochromogenes]